MTVPALTLVMTTAGLGRFTAAQASDDIDLTIASVGLTAGQFVVAPTLTALPGEFRRVTTIAGSSIGDNIVHMIVRDESDLAYDVRGFGLFLADGTLFAVYGQPGVIVGKSTGSALLLALDIAFPAEDIAQLSFGDTNFLNPPATTAVKGVVELATLAEGRAGTDTRRVPPVSVVQAMLTDHLPTGAILLWAGVADTVPAGWVICDGQVAARLDGSGPIATPDLRGRVAVGVSADRAVGDLFGAASVDPETSSGGAHTHDLTVTVDPAVTGAAITSATRNVDAGGSAGGVLTSATLQDNGHTHAATATAADAGAHTHSVSVDVTQPSVALHYIMRL